MSILTKAGKYNDIPDYLMPEMPEAGTTVYFRLIIDPVDAVVNDKPVKLYPNSYVFPPQSEIYDEKTKRTIPIGIVTGLKDDGKTPEGFEKIRFSPHSSGNLFGIVIGSSDLADQKYVYLMLSSNRKDNPNATARAQVLYEYVDAEANAQKSREARRALNAAIIHASTLKDEELLDIALVLGFDSNSSIEVMRDNIEGYATAQPKDYMKKVSDDDTKYKALLKNAFNLEVAYQKGFAIYWTKGDVKICETITDEPLEMPNEFVKFVRTSEQGGKIADLMKKLNEDASKKAARKK